MFEGIRKRPVTIPGLTAICAAAAMILGISATGASADEGFRVSQTCAGCHGTNGASPGSTIPVLGGQSAAYLADAMRGYKDGSRGYYVMKIVANGFDDSQIDAISAWFAEKPWVASTAMVDSAKAMAGKTVADEKCASCHGDNGMSTENGPRLAGQPADYLILSAQAYKSGERTHADAVAALAGIGDADIEAAAHYYASQQ